MLTPLAVSHAPVLRFIQETPGAEAAAIAVATKRVPSNVRRDLPKLEKAGLITLEPLALTDAGVATVALLDGQAAPTVATPPAHSNAPEGFTSLPHHLIQIGALNPRKSFDGIALLELADDIQARGLKQNLLVRPTAPLADGSPCAIHELVAGERRWRAIGLLIERGDLDPNWPIPVKVEALDDKAHALAALLENLQRVDLSPLEEAAAFDQLVNMNGWSTAQVAEKVSKTQRFVQLRLQLLKLTDDQKARLSAGTMTVKDAWAAISNRPDPIEVTPVQLLVLAMLCVRSNPDLDRSLSYWRKAECHFEAETQPRIAELIEAGLVETEEPSSFTPRHGISTTHRGFLALEQHLPELSAAKTPEDRRSAMMLVENRAYAIDKDATNDALNLYAWLDGPFINSPAVQALVDEKLAREKEGEIRGRELQAERAGKEARREAEERAGIEVLAQIRAFEASAPTLTQAGFEEAFSGLLAGLGFVGPYRIGYRGEPHRELEVVIFDGENACLTGHGPSFEALRRLQIIALNHAIGRAVVYSGDDLKVEEGEPDQDIDGNDPAEMAGLWEPDTEEEFLAITTKHFEDRYGQPEGHAINLTKLAYARVNEGEEEYGDDSCEWDRLAALLLADGWAEDFPDTLTPRVTSETGQ